MQFLQKYGRATKQDLRELWGPLLPDFLSPKEKENRIHTLYSNMRKGGRIINRGSKREPQWVLPQ